MNCLACGEPLTPITGILIHPTCDSGPDLSATEAFTIIESALTNQPRSLQKRIGPSELGVPCDRRIGYHLGGVPKVNDRGVAWKPAVGSALHESFADIIARHEIARFADGDDATTTRHHVEERVSVGMVGDTEITGSCDWFDEHRGALWDFKFATRNRIREVFQPNGPGDQYRAQCHLYGRGFARAGYDVRTVGLIVMTRDGEFSDRWVWSEPYDEQVAIETLERASSIALAVDLLGPDFTIPTLPTADAWCNFCPWHKANTTTLSRSCPGHPREAQETPTLAGMLA